MTTTFRWPTTGAQAGDLRTLLTVEQRTSSQDTAGGVNMTWAAIGTVWAHLKGLTAKEIFAAGAEAVEVTHEVSVRYDPIFSSPVANAALRFNNGAGRVFNIHGGVNEDERNGMLIFLVTEGNDQG